MARRLRSWPQLTWDKKTTYLGRKAFSLVTSFEGDLLFCEQCGLCPLSGQICPYAINQNLCLKCSHLYSCLESIMFFISLHCMCLLSLFNCVCTSDRSPCIASVEISAEWRGISNVLSSDWTFGHSNSVSKLRAFLINARLLPLGV